MREKCRELNFCMHRIQIKIEGLKIDRILNRAMEENIDLRYIKMISDMEILCWITPEDLKKLRKLTKSLYKITKVTQRGTAYETKRFIKSVPNIIGVAIAIALVVSQSFFVKDIDVSGYRGIPETELRNVLAEAGIKEGTYIPNINWTLAEDMLYDIFPRITWIQLVHDGRKVILKISESEENKEEYTLSKDDEQASTSSKNRGYCNIVATESGYIDEISAYRGLAIVDEGDYVEKGQILITGYVPIQATYFDEDAPTEYLVRAKGEVFAVIPYRLVFNQERFVSDDLADDNIVINKREKTSDEVEAKVNQQIRSWIKENLPENAQILNKDLNFTYKKNIIEVSVTLEVRCQIGEEQEILIGQENSDSSGS